MSHKEPKISLFIKKLKVRLFVKNNTKTKSKKAKTNNKKLFAFIKTDTNYTRSRK